MPSRLADRLSAARHRRFVGRAGERELFQSALASTEFPFQVLYIFGPGGVGKSTLLREYVSLAEQAGLSTIHVDARNIEPSPESFYNALRLALNLAPEASPVEALAAQPTRGVLLIDTYELLTPLDRWLRDVFLPQLPETVLIVIAGREPPSAAWSADPGWQTLVRTISLRNLNPEESRDYLTRRAIPPEQHQSVLNFTHGHPLALSLVADVFDQRPEVQFQPETAPDVIKVLLERFVQKVPGPAHRAALEACALVRVTTEALLSEMLAMPEVHELFDWLRGLSFIESRVGGLAPHDLAREALIADVRWRNPDWYAELHRRARTYYSTHLAQASGPTQQQILIDYLFLHRDNAVVRPFFDWQVSGNVIADAMRQSDLPSLLAMVARHEGEESAEIASQWLTREPLATVVLREPDGQPGGFLTMLRLNQISPTELATDPGTDAAWRYLQQRAPLRPGEIATHFRFWMGRDTYQSVSPAQSLIFINIVRHYLTTPGLAFTFFPTAEPEFWAPVLAYADLERIPEADFAVEGKQYGVYGHDWRVMPPMTWLAVLAEREIAFAPQTAPAATATGALIVLSRDEFASAVRGALRDFSRPSVLRRNPLLRSRIVVERAGTGAGETERAAALQALLREAAESLKQTPRETKLYRALYHTYFQPARSQEQAAELTDVPFSTFRRHLRAGTLRVTEILWQKEIGG